MKNKKIWLTIGIVLLAIIGYLAYAYPYKESHPVDGVKIPMDEDSIVVKTTTSSKIPVTITISSCPATEYDPMFCFGDEAILDKTVENNELWHSTGTDTIDRIGIVLYDQGKPYLYPITIDFGTHIYTEKEASGAEGVAIKVFGDRFFTENSWSYFQVDNQDEDLTEGFRRIVLNGKIGYVDKNDNVIIEPQYKCAWPFENGKAKVTYKCTEKPDGYEHIEWLSDSWFYIDTNGNRIK